MAVFLLLLGKILPLYIIILLGFVAGKYLRVKKESIAPLLIYMISPVIVFNGVVSAPLTPVTFVLPLLFFGICSSICIVFYKGGKRIWHDATANILGFMAGSGNTGYFGLPVIIAVFGEKSSTYAVLAILGVILFENTVGFFVTARGHHTFEVSLVKLAKLPALYAYALAVFAVSVKLPLPTVYHEMVANFRGIYTILGMMMIGLGIASIGKLEFDRLFLLAAFAGKFLVWPLIMLGAIFLDRSVLHLLNTDIYKVIMLLSVVPFAANSVAYATELKAHPDKASLGVFLSTLFALFYIPLIYSLFLR